MQPFRATWLFLPALALGGCPVYPDGCSSDNDCDIAYVCDYTSGQCVAAYEAPVPVLERCDTSADCESGLVCDRYARCVEPTATGGASGSAGTSNAGRASATSGAAGESGAAGQAGTATN